MPLKVKRRRSAIPQAYELIVLTAYLIVNPTIQLILRNVKDTRKCLDRSETKFLGSSQPTRLDGPRSPLVYMFLKYNIYDV